MKDRQSKLKPDDSSDSYTLIDLDDKEASNDIIYEMDDIDETDIDGAQSNGCIPYAKTAIADACATCYDLSGYIYSKLPSAKSVITGIASVLTTLPVSIYAFTFPMGIIPEALTWELWASQSLSMKMLVIAFTTVSLGTGTLMRYQHIPSMATRIKEIFTSYCPDVPSFLKNNAIVFMSVMAALSSLALGYYGFLWGGQSIAISVSIVNFLITFGFRIETLTELINKIRSVIDQDQKFQNELINELKMLKAHHVAIFDSLLLEEMQNGNPLNEDIVRKCLLSLFDSARITNPYDPYTPTAHIQLFNAPAAMDDIKFYLKKTIDLGLGTLTGGAALILFTQYGFDGFKILVQLVSGYDGMDDLPYAARLSLGLLASASSGVLGFMAGSSITGIANSALDYMQNSTANKIKVALITVCSGVSATSITSATNAMLEKPNLFDMTYHSAAGYYLIGGSWLFAASFDASGIFGLATKHHASTANAIQWLEKHKLSSQTISALNQHSYFSQHKHEKDALLSKDKDTSELTERHSKQITYSSFTV